MCVSNLLVVCIKGKGILECEAFKKNSTGRLCALPFSQAGNKTTANVHTHCAVHTCVEMPLLNVLPFADCWFILENAFIVVIALAL